MPTYSAEADAANPRRLVSSAGGGYKDEMDNPDEPLHDAPVPSTPALPTVDSPPAEAVLDDVPSTAQIIEHAESAEEILGHQPGVDELLGRET
jgi:hypothetical protein